MTDINDSDDYVHRLGKLVPVYVVALIITSESFLRIFVDLIFQAAGSIIIVLAILGLFYYFEIKNQQITRRDQLYVTFGSIILYTGLFLLRLYIDVGVQTEALIGLVVVLWTALTPQIVK